VSSGNFGELVQQCWDSLWNNLEGRLRADSEGHSKGLEQQIEGCNRCVTTTPL
jgi:hypothetical protein